ncbi:MAG: hypothetical protein Q8Q49_04660 [bacterium]|nr:hypothetical protein [bacterium]
MNTQSKDTKEASELLRQLEQAVFEKRPVLGETYRQHGDLSLFEFTKRQFDIPNNSVPEERKHELLDVISKQAERLLGATIAQSITTQLTNNYSVVTSDHHGPITHPDFVNSNLLNSFAMQENVQEGLNTIIVLSFANVSLDNFSFPRGHLVHSLSSGGVSLNQLVFFPSKDRQRPVFRLPSYAKESLIAVKERVDGWVADGIFGAKYAEQIGILLEEIYNTPQMLSQPLFSDQITLGNFHLWKKLFPSKPNLCYIEIETIINELLLQYHLYQDTTVHRLLFDEEHHTLLPKYFEAITGAFSLQNRTGSYLFWALPKDQKYRMQLFKVGKELVTPDGSYRVSLSPESIGLALREKELIPSTLLCFIVLGFYYGLCLIGGGGQTTYFTRMKEAYAAMQKVVGDGEKLTVYQDVPTNRLSFPYPSIAFLKGAKDEPVPATFLDILLYGDKHALDVIRKMAETVTLKQGLTRELPGLAAMLHEGNDPGGAMNGVTSGQIDEMTGMNKRLQFFASLT